MAVLGEVSEVSGLRLNLCIEWCTFSLHRTLARIDEIAPLKFSVNFPKFVLGQHVPGPPYEVRVGLPYMETSHSFLTFISGSYVASSATLLGAST